jgi:hypothetical protein
LTGSLLALRVPAIRGESALGLGARLAWRHGMAIGPFASRSGFSARGLAVGRDAVRLAEIAGQDPAPLVEWSPAVDAAARTVRLAGQRVSLGDWTTTRRCWCGECLAEDRAAAARLGQPPYFHVHHRSLWDISSIPSCIRHKVELRSGCPVCGDGQDWSSRLDSCRCGADLAVPGDGIGRSGIGDDFLHSMLRGEPTPALPFPTPHYDEMERLLVRLGAVGVWLHPRRPVEPHAAADARDRGVAVLADWPRLFHRALDAVAAARPGGRGLIARYGWVYTGWIAGLPDAPYGKVLREAFRRHASGSGAMATDEARLGHIPPSVTVSATGAAKLLRMSFAPARRLLAREGLVPLGSRPGVAFPIRRGSLCRAVGVRERGIGTSDLAVMLGTGRGQARRVAVSLGARSRGGVYDRADAMRRLRKLRSLALPSCDAPLSTRALSSACRSVGVPMEFACAALETGNLRAYVGEQEGLDGLLIVPSELRALRAGRPLSIEAAAMELGVHHEAARALVKLGHIRKGEKGRGVDRADVRRFASGHVAAAELARQLGTRPRTIIERLTGAGLPPEVGPPQCRAAFFRRDAAILLVQECMQRGTAGVAVR